MTVNNDIKIERYTVMKQFTAKQYAKIRPLFPVPPLIPQRSARAAVRRASGAEAVGEDAVCFGLDSTRARKTNGPQSIGKSRGGWCAKIHMVSASGRQAMIFRLSGGQANDAPEGRALPESWDGPVADAPPAMDRACEDD